MKYWIFLVFLVFWGCRQKDFVMRNCSIEEQHNKNRELIKHLKSLEVEATSIIGKNNFTNNSKSKKSSIQKIIKYHGYIIVHSKKQLKSLKNTMTYVIFPKNLKQENRNTKRYKRYSKVLNLIQEMDNLGINKTSNSTIKKYTNQFILTQEKQINAKKVKVETYNYKLANKIIDLFKDKITPSFFDKEGPIFITVTENIFDKKNFSFLYLDLSTFNNSAITQVIDSYKNRLVKKGDSDIDTLEGWNYHILSAITNFSDKFHLLNFAYAGDE